jgi:hypothetical protein
MNIPPTLLYLEFNSLNLLENQINYTRISKSSAFDIFTLFGSSSTPSLSAYRCLPKHHPQFSLLFFLLPDAVVNLLFSTSVCVSCLS